jgi:hypothetical protein
MPWISLQDEANLLQVASEHSWIAVDEIGRSLGDEPIWLVRIGNPPPAIDDRADILYVGCQHGNEQAGREALLEFIEALGQDSSTEVNLVDGYKVLMVPTMNPDGVFLDQRRNLNEVDLNRDWLSLEEPETRVVAQVLGSARPRIVADLHESRVNIDPDNDVEYRGAQHPNAFDDLNDLAIDLRDRLIAHATGNGWDSDIYLSGGNVFNITQLDAHVSFRHAVTQLVETNARDDSGLSEADRTLMQRQGVEEILRFLDDEREDIETANEDSVTAAITKGSSGEPFVLRQTDDLDPAPIAYRVFGLPSVFHLESFGITITQGNIVLMGQSAWGVIPPLMDPTSVDQVITAVALHTLEPTASVASVQEFEPIISGSHRVVVQGWVLNTFQIGFNPEGIEIPILDGDVTFDATAEIFATLELMTQGQDETLRSLLPRRANSLLSPYGHEVFVRRGVDLGTEILWSPLGYFRINTADQEDSPYGPIRLSCSDRMSGIIDGRFIQPRVFQAGRTIASVVSEVVAEIYPNAIVVFDDDLGQSTLGRQLIVEESRYELLKDIADALGKQVHWDGEGVLRFATPQVDVPVWRVKHGQDGVMVEANRSVSREDVFNGVIARGEGTDERPPVQGIAVDTGKHSPTRWDAPEGDELSFGQVPRFYASPILTTNAQAQLAAESILRRSIGMPYSVNYGAVVNPAMRPNMAGRVVYQDGNIEKHITETVTIPLTYDRAMSVETREQTLISIGRPS